MWYDVVQWAAVLLTAVYFVISMAMWIGVRRREAGLTSEQPPVTVVIAARNEEDAIADCLRSLIDQQYPKDKLEIVVVDDRSTDTTPQVVDLVAKKADCRIHRVTISELAPGKSAKKIAIATGVKKASGQIILTTDADCIAEPRWIAEIVARFTPGVGAVAGYAPFDDTTTLWKKILALETLSKAFIAMGSMGLGSGITCTARSFAYRKDVFEEVGGFSGVDHRASGDDTLLLQKISKRHRTAFCTAEKSAVWTAPTADMAGFSNQRIRHLSTAFSFRPPILAVAAMVYTFNVLLLSLPVFLALSGPWQWITFGLGVKLVLDLISLTAVATLLKERRLLAVYLPAALLYVPYIVIFSALGAFGGFQWKSQETHTLSGPSDL